MDVKRYKKAIPIKLSILCIIAISNIGYSENELAPNDHSVEQVEKIIDSKSNDIEELINLPTELPEESGNDLVKAKAESIEYLKQNPEEFEVLLSMLLAQGSAEKLEELLPVYKTLPGYDPSVVDWGNAIILARQGKFDESINLYRKVNAQLPNVKLLRLQMAMALFFNRQYDAAKNEFESLRTGIDNEKELYIINQYLDAINNKNRWNFNAGISFLNDDNLANAPKQGTKLIIPNGSTITYNSPREEGKGLSYNISANKKWYHDNSIFTSLNLGGYGQYYWDNDKFNDVTARFSPGIGFQSNQTELEFSPYYSKRWYGGGVSGDGDLNNYNESLGADFSLRQWTSSKLMYQGLLRYSDVQYVDKYDYNDGKEVLFANTLVYFNSPQQNFSLGLDYSTKNAEDDSNAFDRKGIRLAWGQIWPKGYSTRFNLGYAQRDYEAPNFFGIKRENEEYNAGISFWKRDFSILSLTPRLNIDYRKVESNSPFEEYDKYDVSFELTKTF